jgi:hypothetical protein
MPPWLWAAHEKGPLLRAFVQLIRKFDQAATDSALILAARRLL